MKKVICLLLVAALCCSLSACSVVDACADIYLRYFTVSGTVPTLFGKVVLEIQTDSMSPTFEPGDIIFCEKVEDPSTLRKGDIITYWTIIGGERVLNTHRIVEIYDGGDFLIFETKGDNRTDADPLTVHESEIVAVYRG
jgi:signal peptidase